MITIKKSAIHGMGRFADRGIAKNEMILVPDSFQTGTEDVGYNHSCDPNVLKHGVEKIANRVRVTSENKNWYSGYAMRDILKGEELTIDYTRGRGHINRAFDCACPVCQAL